MNIIDEKYISSFLPIQELDQVRINPSTGVADVLSDDLFFMSQLSAYSTNTRNAIAVSKKIRYQDLKKLLSSELSIAEINISVDDLSNAINELSNKEINDVSSLSDAIMLSTDALSTYINNVRDDLSNTVSSNYVTKYEQLCTVIECFDDISNPAKFASEIYLSDGHLTVTDTIDASSLIVPKNWKLSQSGIRADVSQNITVSADGIQTEIVYPVLSDCYLNCMISAYEQDATDSPLYVYLQTNENNEINRTIIDQLNNPGGYSGLKFYNFYNSSFPIKSWNDTSVIFKYGDNTPFDVKTKINFIEYSFYAVIAKDDLSGYVKKQDPNVLSVLSTHKDDTRMQLYAMMINDDGLVKDVSSLYYGVATNDKLGLIKIGSFDDPKYPVEISDDKAYVEVNHASSNEYGTIKLNNVALLSHLNSIDCGLSVTSNGNGYVPIPQAANDNYGVVKTYSEKYTDRTLSSGISAYLQLDNKGHAYVVIPSAIYGSYGVIKPGLNESTEITMSRSVYVDDVDGIAKVNVAANFGIGQYYDSPTSKGFDSTISVSLNDENRKNSSNINDYVVEFTGDEHYLSAYGDYAWTISAQVNDAFLARVAYEGISDNSLSDATMQIICDSNVITTIDIKHSQTRNGKRFICSQNLGIFSGNGHNGKHMFAAISNNSSFNNGKLWFLIKYINKD